MLELTIKQGRRYVPLFDLPMRLGRADAFKAIGDAVEGLIAFLDEMDGDLDLEETGAEDSFVTHHADGPGCPISDPDMTIDDDACDGDGDEDRDEGECGLTPVWGVDQTKGPLPYAPWADRALMKPHRDRVRQEKCIPVGRPNLCGITHRLQD